MRKEVALSVGIRSPTKANESEAPRELSCMRRFDLPIGNYSRKHVRDDFQSQKAR